MALLIYKPGIAGITEALPLGIEESAQVHWNEEHLGCHRILGVHLALCQMLVQHL